MIITLSMVDELSMFTAWKYAFVWRILGIGHIGCVLHLTAHDQTHEILWHQRLHLNEKKKALLVPFTHNNKYHKNLIVSNSQDCPDCS